MNVLNAKSNSFVADLNVCNVLLAKEYHWTENNLYLNKEQDNTSDLTKIFLSVEATAPLFNLPFKITPELRDKLIDLTDFCLKYIPDLSVLSDANFAKFFSVKSEIKKINRTLNIG